MAKGAAPFSRATSLQKEVWGWGIVKMQATQLEKLKPVNRQARRAIKVGRKKPK